MGRYGTTRRHIAEGAIAPLKLHTSLREGLYAYQKFKEQPYLTKEIGYGAPTGATGAENLAVFKNLQTLYHIKGAGQTILGPLKDIDWGMDVSQDLTNAEGAEHIFGGGFGRGNPLRFATTLATLTGGNLPASAPLMVRLKLRVQDVSGAAECAFGFRLFNAFTANLDDYTDLACINVQGGLVKTETILNNAATVTVDSAKTVVDSQLFELKLIYSGRGVRYFLDGRELIQASTPYQFGAALTLVPFFFFLQGADLTNVFWDEFEFAYLDDIIDSRVSN